MTNRKARRTQAQAARSDRSKERKKLPGLLEAARSELRKDVGEQLAQFAQLVNQANAGLAQNQLNLSKSHEQLDSQFAVLVRLMLSQYNALARSYNLLVEKLLDIGELKDFKVDELTYEDINMMLGQFIKLRSREDYRDHMRFWYEGGNIATLPDPPPPPEVADKVVEQLEQQLAASKKDEGGEIVLPSANNDGELRGFPDDAEFFGGDYGEDDLGDKTSQTEPESGDSKGQVDAMPEGRVEDASDAASDDQGADPQVSEVRNDLRA